MQPHKHHGAEIIEAVLDGAGIDCPADGSTMRIWRKQFQQNAPTIESGLRAVWSRIHGKHFPILSQRSLLFELKNKGSGWLTTITQILLDAGIGLPTRFAFCL
jgi:hypothetical protein